MYLLHLLYLLITLVAHDHKHFALAAWAAEERIQIMIQAAPAAPANLAPTSRWAPSYRLWHRAMVDMRIISWLYGQDMAIGNG